MDVKSHINNLKLKLKTHNKNKQSAEKLRDANFEKAQRGIEEIDSDIRKVTANLQLYDID